MKLSIVAGATSQSVNVFVQDSTSTTGGGKTGLAFNTSGLTAYYSFAGANAGSAAVTLATLAAVGSAYSSGGFKEIDATNMPGWYRLDLPNAAVAGSKGRSVAVHLQGATGMAPCPVEIELTGWDNQDAVRGGMSALPNTACTANASLLTSGTGTDQLSVASGRVDLGKVVGNAQTADANGLLKVDVEDFGGAAGTFASGRAEVNVTKWLGGTIPAVSVTGVPLVDAKYWLGTVLATPATAGVPDVNAKAVNNVSAASVTAVNASLGTTQPVNFTGTAGSALVKSDMVDVAGSAVSTSSAQLGVNAVNIGGQAASLDANNLLKVDAEDWKGSAVTALVNGWVPAVTPIRSGTAQGGGASTITLDAGASATNNLYDNELVYVSGGTGAGQVNTVSSYVGATKVATMIAAWATNPDNTSTFVVLPAGPISATVSGGVNVTQWNGSAVAAPNVSGVPLVDVGYFKGTVSAGAAGYAAPDWGHVNAPTTAVNLSGTTISTSQAVASVSGAVGSVTAGVTVTTNNDKTGYSLAVAPPTAAAVATAVWTDTTASDFTTLTSPGKVIFAQLGGAFTTTSSSIYSGAALALAPTGGSAPTVSQIATAVWQDATAGDFTAASSIGKSLYTTGNAPGAASGLALVGSNVGSATSVSGAVGSVTGNVGGNVVGSVGSVAAGVTVTTNNDKTGYSLTQAFPANFAALGVTAGGKVSGVVLVDTLTAYTGNTPQSGDAYARLGAPAGASVSADVATRATPAQILTAALTESYAAVTVAPTLSQAVFQVLALLSNRSIVGTTLTTQKLDGATAAASYTLNSATTPTSQVRAN